MLDAPAGFTHLNVHSHYSLLQATASPEDLVLQAKRDGLTQLALTDTNALYGAVHFMRACRKYAIRPILGMTLTVAAGVSAADELPGPTEIVLLATGPEGYRSLCALSSSIQARPDRIEAAARGVDWDALKYHRRGLICLSGGRRGQIEQLLRAGRSADAARYASRLAGIYGDDAYLAFELHKPEDAEIAHALLDLSTRFGLPIVAVQPIYCLAETERPLLRLLAAIDRNCALDQVPALHLPGDDDPGVTVSWLPPSQVAERYAAFPDAVQRAAEIARRCDDPMPGRSPIWPVLNIAAEETHDEALARLVRRGLAQRYGKAGAAANDAARRRAERELAAIARSGFAPLFLLAADVVGFARREGIQYSTRGSVANSLVAYCAGITTVDPIAHDLLFERFLNPERSQLPDIDLDFCSRRRDEVLAYVRRTYGEDRVALVATIATLRPRSALRECAKAHDLSDEAVTRLAGLVEDRWHPDPRRRSRDTVDALLEKLADERERIAVRAAFGIVGTPHHLSVHPGGLVITPGPLTEYVPVQWAPKGFLITQYDHQDVEEVGLPKLDLLGIAALTLLADAETFVRRHQDDAFRLASIPADDPRTGKLLAAGDTVGVFQCESTGARRTLRQLQARNVRDLAVANAFFKPGPATGGMAASFVRRYRGEEPPAYLHPALEPILSQTKGVLLFQEQVLRVAVEIAGLSWGEADRLRRGMSKFQPAEMDAIRAAFVEGCKRPAPDGPAMREQQAATLWDQIHAFAGYGFNQGHATAYADVSYRSAYLKAHWPAEFLCARLAHWGGFHHQAIYIAEAQRLGIRVMPPHVNHSRRQFTLKWNTAADGQKTATLWMGLGQVRDLRRSTVRGLMVERRSRPFENLRDLCLRVPIQPKELTHLVQCGALDGLAANRAALLDEAGELRRGSGLQQMSFGFDLAETPEELPEQRIAWEQRILGLPVSVSPLAAVRASVGDSVSVDLPPANAGRDVAALAFRLPGWTGGRGWFFGDGATYTVAAGRKGMAAPRPWRPILVRGRWQRDEWDGDWLHIEEWQPVDPD